MMSSSEVENKIANVVRFKPPMDFVRAKLTLGLKASLKYEDLSMEEVQKNFVTKNMQVYSSSISTKSTPDIFRLVAK